MADTEKPFAKDLIQRHFGPCEELDRRYVGDITYVATWEGWAYLATVIDLAISTRRGLGAGRPHAHRARRRGPGDGLRPAPTRQRASSSTPTGDASTRAVTTRKLARTNGVVLSVGRKGECWDNAVAESFFATIKRELIDMRAWPTRAGLRRAVFEYIEGWYNTRRLHSSLGYMSPAKYEALIHHNADRQAA